MEKAIKIVTGVFLLAYLGSISREALAQDNIDAKIRRLVGGIDLLDYGYRLRRYVP